MAQVTFGTVLQEARERKGLDLSTAARRLRIRPDILRSIEEDDFARMPPRGYTRNMVNAYARLLGLNPTEITRMYLDEAYAYQVGRARSDVRPSGFDMGGTSRTKRSGAARPAPHEEPEERVPRQNAFGRTLYDDRTSYTRPDYGRGAAPATGARLYSEDRTHTSRHSALPNGHYTNFYAGPKAPSGVQSKLPFVIAGAVILVVLIVVLVFAFGGKGGGEEDLPAVPVTGIDDTTQGEGDEGSQETRRAACAGGAHERQGRLRGGVGAVGVHGYLRGRKHHLRRHRRRACQEGVRRHRHVQDRHLESWRRDRHR